MAFLSYSPYLKQSIVQPGDFKISNADLDRREFFLILPLLLGTVVFGLFPNLILDTLHYSVSQLLVDIGTNEFSKYNYFFVDTTPLYA